MDREESWKLFFATGLPEAYTYLKARERSPERRREESPGGTPRRG
jgi:hypothetical protein